MSSSCTKDGRVIFERTISSSLLGFWFANEARELVEGSKDGGEFPLF